MARQSGRTGSFWSARANTSRRCGLGSGPATAAARLTSQLSRPPVLKRASSLPTRARRRWRTRMRSPSCLRARRSCRWMSFSKLRRRHTCRASPPPTLSRSGSWQTESGGCRGSQRRRPRLRARTLARWWREGRRGQRRQRRSSALCSRTTGCARARRMCTVLAWRGCRHTTRRPARRRWRRCSRVCGSRCFRASFSTAWSWKSRCSTHGSGSRCFSRRRAWPS
mmetsp:Transcript_29075/g.88102  ORF Transcript_29075/g.88102 Transcript_29075/m.88102 type:complete len:224 (+) Transcript_29075:114-785(+)